MTLSHSRLRLVGRTLWWCSPKLERNSIVLVQHLNKAGPMTGPFTDARELISRVVSKRRLLRRCGMDALWRNVERTGGGQGTAVWDAWIQAVMAHSVAGTNRERCQNFVPAVAVVVKRPLSL